MSSGICNLCNKWSSTIEEHHPLPQAHGGRRKGKIRICANCHGAVHRSSSDAVFAADWMSSLPKERRELAKTLLQIIERAEATIPKEAIEVRATVPIAVHERLKLAAVDRRQTLEELLVFILTSAVGMKEGNRK